MALVENTEHVLIERLELGPYGTNAYILKCKKTNQSVLIDAPGGFERIQETLGNTHLNYILMTHSHFDHTGALSRLKSSLDVKIASHASDVPQLPEEADLLLEDGDTISFGEIRLDVLHTPGHTPGSLCFLTPPILISGDTLFPGGPGKTGSPKDFLQIIKSLEEKLFPLPNETRVYPGHGDSTDILTEKQAFDRFTSRTHPPDLCGDVLWESS